MDEEKLIIENIPLIYMAIKNKHIYYDTNDEFQDYYDAGLDGLINGVRTFDESKGYKISTYLYKCICNEIGHKVYLGSMKKRKNKYGKNVSLNMIISEGTEVTEFEDFIPDPNENVEEEVNKIIEKSRLLYSVNKLKKEKDKLIIKMYYGLDGYEELGNYEAVGRIIGISREAVRQKLIRALRDLRPIYEKIKDKEFLTKIRK